MLDDTVIDSRYLQTCDIPTPAVSLRPFVLVIFGGAGDLSRRKLIPSLFRLFAGKELPEAFSVVAFDRAELDDARYRAMMEEAIRRAYDALVVGSEWDEFARHLFYLGGHFDEDESFLQLGARIDRTAPPASGGSRNVIYYMAVPPEAVPAAVERMKTLGLRDGSNSLRIVVEKPFGADRQSAARLNGVLSAVFDENQIFRIDHYLAKEPVDNIIFFHFTNTIFEEVWNRRYVDNVQITMAEDIGIEHRGAFYEKSGVVRDMVQNHLLQILCLTAMEAPIGFTADFIRDEKLKILRSIRPLDDDYIDRSVVRGQYGAGIVNGREVPGYRGEQDVSPSSQAATFFAGKFYVDNLRWAGVPFYLRTGKRLSKRITEICLQFKRLPLRLFGRTCDTLERDVLHLTIQPDERISLRFHVKYPYSTNQLYQATMDFSYAEAFKTPRHDAYERLLLDVVKGDLTLFVREDTIEQMWTIVDPINARWEAEPSVDLLTYPAGSWGPAAAEELLELDGRTWLTR